MFLRTLASLLWMHIPLDWSHRHMHLFPDPADCILLAWLTFTSPPSLLHSHFHFFHRATPPFSLPLVICPFWRFSFFMCALGNFTMPQKAFTWRGEVGWVTINKRHHPLINNIMDNIILLSAQKNSVNNSFPRFGLHKLLLLGRRNENYGLCISG